MRNFDSNVQVMKYKVLKEVARHSWNDEEIFSVFDDIAKKIVKRGEPSTSCCIYKDRAKIAERIKIALGGNKENPNIIEVIDIVCDECPEAGHVVTDLCRGCLAHKCAGACKVGAIEFGQDNKAKIDKSKCVECGRCAEACPYSAINNFKRPCEKACKIDAIHMAETGEAEIDNAKCTSCGACMVQCPFGATVDKSYITEVIKYIKKSENNTKYKVNAIIAPAFASQFEDVKIGQVVTAIKELGFTNVYEAAQGADVVAYKEAQELAEKGFLTTSCCPAFVRYVKINFPELADNISHNLSPMAEMGRIIKEKDPDCVNIFIGPCTAKKAEIKKESVKPYIDAVLTFEELIALIDSRDIEMESLPEDKLDDASGFGRQFARSGGVAEAVCEALEELGSDFVADPIACEGLDKCKMTLLRASKNVLKNNLIEGMACSGGCIGGAGCLTHSDKYRVVIDEHAKDASRQEIKRVVEEIC